ncbi:hypothetical protein V8C86DRAFT_2788943 [Haematococcus lacustris]
MPGQQSRLASMGRSSRAVTYSGTPASGGSSPPAPPASLPSPAASASSLSTAPFVLRASYAGISSNAAASARVAQEEARQRARTLQQLIASALAEEMTRASALRADAVVTTSSDTAPLARTDGDVDAIVAMRLAATLGVTLPQESRGLSDLVHAVTRIGMQRGGDDGDASAALASRLAVARAAARRAKRHKRKNDRLASVSQPDSQPPPCRSRGRRASHTLGDSQQCTSGAVSLATEAAGQASGKDAAGQAGWARGSCAPALHSSIQAALQIGDEEAVGATEQAKETAGAGAGNWVLDVAQDAAALNELPLHAPLGKEARWASSSLGQGLGRRHLPPAPHLKLDRTPAALSKLPQPLQLPQTLLHSSPLLPLDVGMSGLVSQTQAQAAVQQPALLPSALPLLLPCPPLLTSTLTPVLLLEPPGQPYMECQQQGELQQEQQQQGQQQQGQQQMES